MGIKDLNTFLSKNVPQCHSFISISDISGYAIAIDSSLILHSYIAVAQKEIINKTADPLETIDRNIILEYAKEKLFGFIEKFLTYNITLVWIWDGESIVDKIKAHERRAKQKSSIYENINRLKYELSNMHPLARDAYKINELRSYLTQLVYVTNDEKILFKNLLSSLGFPCFTAQTEAETLCASLAREGKVAGVWSTDTDNFPLGTPMMLTGFEGYTADKHPKIKVSFSSVVLTNLQLSKEEFIDFCIMLECDFNERMPNIGPVKALKLINNHHNIDSAMASEPNLPWEKLNHLKCRQCFEHLPSNIEMDQLQLNKNSDLLKSHHSLHKLVNNISKPNFVVFS